MTQEIDIKETKEEGILVPTSKATELWAVFGICGLDFLRHAVIFRNSNRLDSFDN